MFFYDTPELTKYGYYLVNDTIKTFSKFEAYQLAGKNWKNIRFIFNDDEFEKYDWTVEPEEDIYELYRQRAQQLREKYDYVVLMYSGGIDSHTILETFLQNNIKLDEICTFSVSDTEDKLKSLNPEVFRTALPFIETLNLKKIGTVFRDVEVGKLILDWWNDDFHAENFQYYTIQQQWSGVVRSYYFKSKIKEHMALIENGKTVCYIWGSDKPSMCVTQNHYALYIPDGALDLGSKQYVNRLHFNKKFYNFYDEPFYICREFPKISIKQSHLLVNLMETIPKTDSRLLLKGQLPTFGPFVSHHVENNIVKFLDKATIDGCIYPNALLSRFRNDKIYNASLIISPKDNWFLSSNHPNRYKFEEQITKIIKENQNYFYYTNAKNHRLFKQEEYKDTIPKNAGVTFSRLYFIRPVSNLNNNL